MKAVGLHLHHIRKLFQRQFAVWPGRFKYAIQCFFLPFPVCDFGSDLLCEHIQWLHGYWNAVELIFFDGCEQRHAFDQIIATEREQPGLWDAGQMVSGPARPLQEGGDTAG